ncbi:MAG: acyl-CoA thioesterase [Gammaproteobacteria bacterium]|nr:acyl-CoA thioesterase [Gammaproteobacteria bacterium]
MQGLLHNSHYLVYFGIALNEYYRALNYDRLARGEADNAELRVISAEVHYRKPIRFDDELEIGVRVARMGRSSITFEYRVVRRGDTDPAAEGRQVWVYVSRETQKSTAWPDDFVSLIREVEGPEVFAS